MDEMRIASKFTQGIIIKILKKILVKKLEINPDIHFESPIELTIDDKTAHVHLDITVEAPKDDIMKIVKDYI